MTDQLDVKAIRDLCLKATHGPWYAVPPPWANGEWVNAWSEDPHGGKPICDCSMQIDHDDGSEEFEPRCIPDADFIAQSRTLIPKLCDRVESVEAENAKLRAEMERLQGWVNDLHSGMYINCVYCGHRYGPNKDTPVAMADVLKAHIEVCPKHPMSQLRIENARLRAELDALKGKNAE